MTFTAGSVLTAAQLNVHLRDNLNETAAAKATTSGSYFVANGANSIVEKGAAKAETLGSVNTSSLSYGNTGPSVTRTVVSMALAIWSNQASNSTANASSVTSVSMSGGINTAASSDDYSIVIDGQPAGNSLSMAMAHLFTGLTPGSTTFNMQYRVGSGTGTFQRRRITVLPF